MSLATWRTEYYPIDDTAELNAYDAIRWTKSKWIGLRKDNLIRHKLTKMIEVIIDKDRNYLVIGPKTSQMCNLWRYSACKRCPLFSVLKHSCDDEYNHWLTTGDPEPMIKLFAELKVYALEFDNSLIHPILYVEVQIDKGLPTPCHIQVSHDIYTKNAHVWYKGRHLILPHAVWLYNQNLEEIPKDKMIAHKCNIRSCFNMQHLELSHTSAIALPKIERRRRQMIIDAIEQKYNYLSYGRVNKKRTNVH